MATFADHRAARSRQGRARGGRQGRRNSRVELSKRLTYTLRHGADKLGLQLRPDGFARLDELLSMSSFRGVSQQQVEEVVAADEKGRMTITSFSCEASSDSSTPPVGSELFIRANQGHSMKGVVDEDQLLTKIRCASDIPVCVHGTNSKCWPSIREEGLRCMNRTHIHFAAGLPGESGVISGMRRSCKVLIYVDVAAAMSDGVAFFRSSNNVILSSGKGGILDPRYFSHVEGVSDGEPWKPPTPPVAVTSAASKPAPPDLRGEAAAAAAAAESVAAIGQRRTTSSRVKQLRARSEWMLDRPVTVAGGGRTGCGGGGGGDRGGEAETGEKPAAESETCLGVNTGGGKRPATGGGASSDDAGAAGGVVHGMEIGGASGRAGPACVDVYAILDFEATCDDKGIGGVRFGPQEVIEFPTVLLDATSLDVVDEFRVYVRPVRNPTLTTFCTNLTGIEQPTVDSGVLFAEALLQHTEFLRRNSCLPGQRRSCLFVTCGDWDLKTMMPGQCKLIGANVPSHFKAWANIKKVFQEVVHPERRGSRGRLPPMPDMLSSLGLTLVGRHHSGLDDSRNIARIARELCRRSRRPIRATTVLPPASDEGL
eukprot:g10864.t1